MKSEEQISLEYLDKLLDYGNKILSEPLRTPILVYGVNDIDFLIKNGNFRVDKDNKVWSGSYRVMEDPGFGRQLKYNNEE